MPLNPNAQKWIEALRSGKYKQTQGRLRTKLRDDGLGHCCLGVACQVYLEETGQGQWEVLGRDYFVIDDKRRYARLPDPVRAWLGLGTSAGDFVGSASSLAAANDSWASFEDIAYIIEHQPPGLFEFDPKEAS